MLLIMDALLLAASLVAAFYCHVLAGRLRRFTALESGMGGAIAVLSAQVDDMTRALTQAREVAGGTEKRLERLSGRAEALAGRLELLVASMHDLPETADRPARAEHMPAAARVRTRRVLRHRSVQRVLEGVE